MYYNIFQLVFNVKRVPIQELVKLNKNLQGFISLYCK